MQLLSAGDICGFVGIKQSFDRVTIQTAILKCSVSVTTTPLLPVLVSFLYESIKINTCCINVVGEHWVFFYHTIVCLEY